MTDDRYLLDDVEVRRQTCHVYVDRRGRFFGVTPRGTETLACRDHETVVAELATILTREKVRVSIPFVTAGFERAVATGIHAGTGSVLYDCAGSRGLQLESGHVGSAYHNVSDEQLAEGRRRQTAWVESRRALEEWQSTHRWQRFGHHVAEAVTDADKEPAS